MTEDIKELLNTYDRLCETATEAELEAWLSDACREAEQEEPDELLKISVLYNELGSFYRHRGRLSEAERAFIKAKATMERTVCDPVSGCKCCFYTASLPDDLFGFEESSQTKTANYGTILNNLAGTYRLKKNYREAITLFQRAIEIYEAHPEIPMELSCSAYNNLALVYLDQEREEEAISVFRKILEKLGDNADAVHERATTYANLVVAYWRAAERKKAEEAAALAQSLYLEAGLEDSQEYQAFLQLKEMLEARI